MEEIRVAEKRLSDYRAIIGGPAFAEILALASKLKGKRVAHVNATGYGGGVAELLHSLVPLQRDVGLDVTWFVLGGSTPTSKRTTRPSSAPASTPRRRSDSRGST